MKCLPLFMLSVMFCLFSQATLGSDKYALLIGVTTYKNSHMNGTRLTYPEADATAVAELLKNSGYEVHVLLGKDADRKSIEKALGEFETHGSQDGVVVIGLFGHGVQYGSEAYFCPYDTVVRKVKDSQGQVLLDKRGQPRLEPDPGSLTSMQRLLEALNTSGAGNRVLLADCCRNDPSVARDPLFTELTDRAFGSTVTINDLKPGTAVMFSCSDGERSFEHSQWEHGAFTKAFLEYCGQLNEGSDSTVSTMMTPLSRRVSAMVSDLSPGKSQKINPITNGIVDLQLRLSVPTEITNSIGMKLKLIPAGEFLMGSSDADVAAALKADSSLSEGDLKDERPQHRVKISRPFYAGVYEVTQGEYEAVMGSNPSIFSASGGGETVAGQNTSRFPVEKVSWYDAVAFCNALSVREGLAAYYTLTSVKRYESGGIKSATVTSASGVRQSPATSGYRLPTEAEWEYMCRAGTRSAYWFGNVLNGDKANVDGNHPFGTTTKGTYLGRPSAVGSYAANPFGLYDTHGNVEEWCEDDYDESAYGSRSGTTADPLSSSGSEYRLLRGGPWFYFSRSSRSAYRHGSTPDNCNSGVGFRVVR